MYKNNIKLELKKLPKDIPAIMDSQVFLLPGAEVVFKIKALGFQNVIDFSFKNSDRYISVYNANDSESSQGKIATIGKIIKFREASNGKYTVVVKGIIRFNIAEVIKIDKDINILKTDYKNFTDDLFGKNLIFKNRDYLNETITEYFLKTNNSVLEDIDLKEITDIKLLSLLTNQLKFNKYEKRKLLRSNDSEEINSFITNLLEYELAIVESRSEAKH